MAQGLKRRTYSEDVRKGLGDELIGATLVLLLLAGFADFSFGTLFFDTARFDVSSSLSESLFVTVVGWILWIGGAVAALAAIIANYLAGSTDSWVNGIECINCGEEVQPEDLSCFGCGLVFDEEIECGYCGASIDGQSNFCRACGKEFGGPSCAHCEEPVDLEDLFCSHCGKSTSR